MNKYDFDFKRIEDILYDVLGITEPTNIDALKLQIQSSLKALSDAIDKKCARLSPAEQKKAQKQKIPLNKELEGLSEENDLEKLLRKCITIKYLTLLSLDVKVRHSDSYEEKERKKLKRNEIFAVSDLVRSVPSILDLMKQRDLFLKRVDSKKRVIQYSTAPDKWGERLELPQSRLDIQFTKKPRSVSGLYGQILEEAGIYAYKFGDLIYSRCPNDDGVYTEQVTRKNLVGIIKKDEFDVLRKYTILMDDVPNSASPEFCRDILFNDMLLRNAKNNFGYIGIPKRFSQDRIYGHRISFDGDENADLLRVIHLENDPMNVVVNSNVKRISSLKDTYALMQEKMEQALRELFDQDENNHNDRGIGDD